MKPESNGHQAFRISGAIATTLASIIVTFGCAKQAAVERNASNPEIPHSSQVRQVLTLPSGHQLKVIQVGPVYSTTTRRVLGVMIAYETDIPISNVAALAHEADGIFKYFHMDAERWGYSSAILSATEPVQGSFFSRSQGYRFVYERDHSGKWKRTNVLR
jgi:hypothetical protein